MKLMKVAAGRSFFAHVRAEAKEVVPDLCWVLTAADGSWSESPEDCDLVVLAGDAYTSAFVETVLKLPAIRWVHTEDAGTDGRFYDAMRARGVTVTHSAWSSPLYLPRVTQVWLENLRRYVRGEELLHKVP